MNHRITFSILILVPVLLISNARVAAQAIPDTRESSSSPSSSLMVTQPPVGDHDNMREAPHTLRDSSMFAIAPPRPRTFLPHDLVQIIIRESSKASSSHELETTKEYNLDGKISAFPRFSLSDLFDLQVDAGRTTGLPRVGVDFTSEFSGEGDYDRSDELTARLTAEILEILPNGNLILEARTFIKNDEEEMTIKVTGICRPEDITAANTILSNQIHDLKVKKTHEGELKKANEKGFVARILDVIFAF